MSKIIHDIAQRFSISPLKSIHAITDGHIHATYRVKDQHNNAHIIQCIPPDLFSHPEFFSQNMAFLAEQKLPWALPQFHRCEQGVLYQDAEQALWRAYPLIKGEVRSQIENVRQAQQVGQVFGAFSGLKSQSDLRCPIKGFNHLPTIWQNFIAAKAADVKGRLAEVRPWVDQLSRAYPAYLKAFTYGERHSLPKRVLHGDPKITNLVFEKDEVVGILDLDTVQVGYLYMDFSDALRNIANAYNETGFVLDHITPFIEAYCAAAKPTQEERLSLQVCLTLVPWQLAVRFITDYLNGDIYFRVQHKTHNLARAKAQLALAERLKVIEKESSIMLAFGL